MSPAVTGVDLNVGLVVNWGTAFHDVPSCWPPYRVRKVVCFEDGVDFTSGMEGDMPLGLGRSIPALLSR